MCKKLLSNTGYLVVGGVISDRYFIEGLDGNSLSISIFVAKN